MEKIDTISLDEYQRFKRFLEHACGILLGEGKEYLVVSRLTKLLRDQHIMNVAELLTTIERGYSSDLRDAVIDAMTTNETSWFRDKDPFEALQKQVFPQWESEGKKHCRIWSSACSSGQEPFTISIALEEYLALAKQSALENMHILATDISDAMLQQAAKAHYEEASLLRGLSPQRKQQFFKPMLNHWTVNDDIKRRVTFKKQNLLFSYEGLGKFDAIFCRNVLIYFSTDSKTDILKRMALVLNPRGYLFLGASETITGYCDAFEMIRSPYGVFYQLKS